MMGYCWRTSAAASRPSSTSCFGVYLFLGSLMTVCACELPAAIANIASEAASLNSDVRVMDPILAPSGFHVGAGYGCAAIATTDRYGLALAASYSSLRAPAKVFDML